MECVVCGHEWDYGYEYDHEFVCEHCVEKRFVNVAERFFGAKFVDSDDGDLIVIDGEDIYLDDIDNGELLTEYGACKVYPEEDDRSDYAYEEWRDSWIA